MSAEELFVASCIEYWPGEARHALLRGFDSSDISRMNKALRLADKAAEADKRAYGFHAKEMRRFAESLGQLMVVYNDPTSGPADHMQAATEVHIPANECPDPPPNSGGLPLPGEP